MQGLTKRSAWVSRRPLSGRRVQQSETPSGYSCIYRLCSTELCWAKQLFTRNRKTHFLLSKYVVDGRQASGRPPALPWSNIMVARQGLLVGRISVCTGWATLQRSNRMVADQGVRGRKVERDGRSTMRRRRHSSATMPCEAPEPPRQ